MRRIDFAKENKKFYLYKGNQILTKNNKIDFHPRKSPRHSLPNSLFSMGSSKRADDLEYFLGRFIHFWWSISGRLSSSLINRTASLSTPSFSGEIVLSASCKALWRYGSKTFSTISTSNPNLQKYDWYIYWQIRKTFIFLTSKSSALPRPKKKIYHNCRSYQSSAVP